MFRNFLLSLKGIDEIFLWFFIILVITYFKAPRYRKYGETTMSNTCDVMFKFHKA